MSSTKQKGLKIMLRNQYHLSYINKKMETIIEFNETGFSKRINDLKSVALDLTKLVESFYDLQVIADKGIQLNKLVYDENYINDLLSNSSEVKRLKFKNNKELYKFYVNESEHLKFESNRLKVKERLTRLHIPTDYYMINNSLVEFKVGLQDSIKKQFETRLTSDSELAANDLLNDLLESVNKIQSLCGVNSQVVRGMNIDLRQWYSLRNGEVKASMQGIKKLSEFISLKQGKSFAAESNM
jgi:hypothetical protein